MEKYVKNNAQSVTSGSPEARPIEANITRNLSMRITEVFTECNPEFKHHDNVTRKVLTNPSEPMLNDGHDNKEANLICFTNDQVESASETYTIVDLLGVGTFGQVFKCIRQRDGELIALKIVKNKTAYRNQGLIEVQIAQALNSTFDPRDEHNIVRFFESFEHKNHICIVFELLGISLLDVLTQNQYRGLPLTTVQLYSRQLLTAFAVLEKAKIIHCDLKPENVLISTRKGVSPTKKEGNSSFLKLIDLGSSCFEGKTLFSYIQSRFYRSPEVLLGYAYNRAIDMWSLGCVCTEMYLGLPLFPGVSTHNQLFRIVDMFGNPPNYLIEGGKHGKLYFKRLRQRKSVAEDEQSGRLSSVDYSRSMSSAPLQKCLSNPNPIEPSTNDMINIRRHKSISMAQQQAPKPSTGVTGLVKSLTSRLFSSGKRSSLDSAPRMSFTSINVAMDAPGTTSDTAPPPVAESYSYVIKTNEEFAAETNTELPEIRKYLRYKLLDDIIMKCPFASRGMRPEQKIAEMELRKCFLDFLHGLFEVDPKKRWSASQASQHPFITGAPFHGPFIPQAVVEEPQLVRLPSFDAEKSLNSKRTNSVLKVITEDGASSPHSECQFEFNDTDAEITTRNRGVTAEHVSSSADEDMKGPLAQSLNIASLSMLSPSNSKRLPIVTDMGQALKNRKEADNDIKLALSPNVRMKGGYFPKSYTENRGLSMDSPQGSTAQSVATSIEVSSWGAKSGSSERFAMSSSMNSNVAKGPYGACMYAESVSSTGSGKSEWSLGSVSPPKDFTSTCPGISLSSPGSSSEERLAPSTAPVRMNEYSRQPSENYHFSNPVTPQQTFSRQFSGNGQIISPDSAFKPPIGGYSRNTAEKSPSDNVADEIPFFSLDDEKER